MESTLVIYENRVMKSCRVPEPITLRILLSLRRPFDQNIFISTQAVFLKTIDTQQCIGA